MENVDVALPVRFARVAYVSRRRVHPLDRPPRDGEKRPARLGEDDPARPAFEKRAAELLLKQPQLVGGGGLRQEELVCRGGYVSVTRGCEKDLELALVHRSRLPSGSPSTSIASMRSIISCRSLTPNFW